MNHSIRHLAIPLAGLVLLTLTSHAAWAAEEGATWRGWNQTTPRMEEVVYDGLPLAEVVNQLQESYDHQFDVIIPEPRRVEMPPQLDPATGLPKPAVIGPMIETDAQMIRLRLRNVTVTEVFEAMNLLFEEQRNLIRWEWVLNGKRPTAVLRLLERPAPRPEPPTKGPQQRAVFFVGNLIDQENGSFPTMRSLVDVLYDLAITTYEHKDDAKMELPIVKYHEETDLLVVRGTEEEIDTLTQTLEALRERELWKTAPRPVRFDANGTPIEPTQKP